MASKEKEETSDQFATRLNSHLMSSFVTIGLAYGDRLGLFEVLSTYDSPKTAKEIAEAAKLKERWVPKLD